jgi:hypothetical protein
MVEELHALPVDRFADTLLDGVARWSERGSGASQKDDITLLAIHFNGVNKELVHA